MRLRRGGPGDVAQIARMLRSTYDRMTFIPRLHTPEEDLAYVTSLFADHEAWVAADGDDVLGFAILSSDQLLQIHVDPGRQNQGIGTLLLRRMESIIELEGADRVQLDTLSDNVRAVNFYQHQGYRILVLKREGGTGSDPQTSVRLEKRLSPYRGPLNDDED